MSDFPGMSLLMPHGDIISVAHPWSLGAGILQTVSGLAWPAANRAEFVPFRVPYPVTVYKLACGTGTANTGNFDLGIYDANGTRLVSTGSTPKTTAGVERIIDVTDTFLLPGLYYLAMAVDGTAAYIQTSGQTWLSKMAGIREMSSAFALPATATFATASTGNCPIVAAYLRSE